MNEGGAVFIQQYFRETLTQHYWSVCFGSRKHLMEILHKQSVTGYLNKPITFEATWERNMHFKIKVSTLNAI